MLPTLTLRKDVKVAHARVVLYLAGDAAAGVRRAWGTVDGFVTGQGSGSSSCNHTLHV
jgi:hypothetical protein